MHTYSKTCNTYIYIQGIEEKHLFLVAFCAVVDETNEAVVAFDEDFSPLKS